MGYIARSKRLYCKTGKLCKEYYTSFGISFNSQVTNSGFEYNSSFGFNFWAITHRLPNPKTWGRLYPQLLFTDEGACTGSAVLQPASNNEKYRFYILNIYFLIGLFYFLTQAEALRSQCWRPCSSLVFSDYSSFGFYILHAKAKSETWENIIIGCVIILRRLKHCAPSANA